MVAGFFYLLIFMVAGFFFFFFGFIAEILLLVFCLGFIVMVAKIFWHDSWVQHVLLGGCSGFQLVVGG